MTAAKESRTTCTPATGASITLRPSATHITYDFIVRDAVPRLGNEPVTKQYGEKKE